MVAEHKYEGQERRVACTTRRVTTTENDVIIAVLEERLSNIKEENRRDHELIMNKLDESAKVHVQIVEIQVQVAKIIQSNIWRDWAVRLIYTGGIVMLLVDALKSFIRK